MSKDIVERLNTVYILCQIEADTLYGKTKMRLEDASVVAKDAVLEIERLQHELEHMRDVMDKYDIAVFDDNVVKASKKK